MSTPEFTIADDNGIVAGIKDPLEIKDPEPKAGPKVKSIRQDPKPTAKRPVGRPSKSDLEKEAQKEIQVLLMGIALLWSTRDKDDCSGVLATQSKDISESLATILAKHPALLAKLTGASNIGDYLMLITALLPVVNAITENHIKPALAKRSEDGNI